MSHIGRSDLFVTKQKKSTEVEKTKENFIPKKRDIDKPIKKYRRGSGSKTTQPLPSWDDALKVLEHLKRTDPMVATLVFITLRTGLRSADLLELKWKHVKDGKIHKNDKKTNKYNGLKIKQDCMDWLMYQKNDRMGYLHGCGNDDYIASFPPKYIYGDRGRVGKGDYEAGHIYCNKILKKAINQIVPEWVKSQSTIGFHTIRKTFARHLYENLNKKIDAGEVERTFSPIDVVSALLNHGSVKDTFKYIGVLYDTQELALDLVD